jgi:hypothetical protein
MSQRVLGRRFKQLLLKRIARERELKVEDLTIMEARPFEEKYWGHDIGYVTVKYNPQGYWATYGFDALANVTIYAD